MSFILGVLKQSSVFSGLRDDVLESLASHATVRVHEKGECLWHRTDRATTLIFLLRGVVMVSRTNEGGERTVVGLRGPGECIGESAAIGGGAYPADAVVHSATATCVRLPRSLLDVPSEVQHQLDAIIRASLLQHIHALRMTVDVLSARTIGGRLALLFLKLAERFGREEPNGLVRIPVVLSRADLASLTGARTETVIRALSPWQKDGSLVTDNEGFVIVRSVVALRAVTE